jgi:hypothetical protein
MHGSNAIPEEGMGATPTNYCVLAKNVKETYEFNCPQATGNIGKQSRPHEHKRFDWQVITEKFLATEYVSLYLYTRQKRWLIGVVWGT